MFPDSFLYTSDVQNRRSSLRYLYIQRLWFFTPCNDIVSVTVSRREASRGTSGGRAWLRGEYYRHVSRYDAVRSDGAVTSMKKGDRGLGEVFADTHIGPSLQAFERQLRTRHHKAPRPCLPAMSKRLLRHHHLNNAFTATNHRSLGPAKEVNRVIDILRRADRDPADAFETNLTVVPEPICDLARTRIRLAESSRYAPCEGRAVGCGPAWFTYDDPR
ncbi:hypothetical protein BD309DRAFT_958893 [Dichomitus squalens]|nr:hypothetical protein BD309DRAFT_958893 [Dichomitus squalens]